MPTLRDCFDFLTLAGRASIAIAFLDQWYTACHNPGDGTSLPSELAALVYPLAVIGIILFLASMVGR